MDSTDNTDSTDNQYKPDIVLTTDFTDKGGHTMSITTNDKVRLIQANTEHIREYLAMYNELCEGDFGIVFRHFHSDHPEMGRYVVEHAIATYKANEHKWAGIGQFTANYHVLVIKYSQAQFTQKWAYQDKWLVWGNVR